MKELTEKEAWESIAKLYGETASKGQATFALPSHPNKPTHGICFILTLFIIDNLISEDVYHIMMNKIKSYKKKRKKKCYLHPSYTTGQWLWPNTVKGALQRARFCERMAKEI